MPYAPIKMSAPKDNYLDAITTTQLTILDSNGYMWGTGTTSGDGTTIARSTPVPVINDRKYSRLIPCGTGALDEYSYAWAWGFGLYLGVQTSGTYYGPPQSVLGGIQWIKLECVSSGGGCGLDSNSYAWAWGQNTYGVSGDNQNVSRSSPVSVVGGMQFIDISAGYDNALALDSSSYAWGWGYNIKGVLGDNTESNRSSPVSVVGGRQFNSIYATTYANFAMDSSSYVWGWGYNDSAQLGDGTLYSKSSPTFIGVFDAIFPQPQVTFAKYKKQWYAWGENREGQYGNGNFIRFSQSIAINFPFVLKKFIKRNITTNTVSAAFDVEDNLWVWGVNNSGGLGINEITNKSIPTKVAPIMQYGALYKPPGEFIKIISNQRATNNEGISLFLDKSSYAWAWGYNSGAVGSGWLGDNSSRLSSSSPISVVGGLQFLDLAVSKTKTVATDRCHILGLDISSYAWAWGENTHGQLGDNAVINVSDISQNRSSPVSVVGGRQWQKLLAGHFHSIGLDLSSYVWCWGANAQGQLGNGLTTLASSPVSVIGDIQAIDIAVGATHSILLSASSYIWAWGNNANGQLGTNSILNYSSPVSVIGDMQFRQITSNGANSTWGLNLSSYVWAWGSNTNGVLGNNLATSSSSPISVVGGRQFVFVSGSVLSCVCLDVSSYAWVWGSNSNAQLGDTTTAGKSSPISVFGNKQWGFVDMGAALIGGTSYPNSVIVVCGTNIDNRFGNYVTNFSSPVVVNFSHSYISPTSIKWKNILGK